MLKLFYILIASVCNGQKINYINKFDSIKIFSLNYNSNYPNLTTESDIILKGETLTIKNNDDINVIYKMLLGLFFFNKEGKLLRKKSSSHDFRSVFVFYGKNQKISTMFFPRSHSNTAYLNSFSYQIKSVNIDELFQKKYPIISDLLRK